MNIFIVKFLYVNITNNFCTILLDTKKKLPRILLLGIIFFFSLGAYISGHALPCLHMASSGSILGIVSPVPSAKSISLSLIFSHSKHCISKPKPSSTIRIASVSPGQALQLIPYGINLYAYHSSVSNRSGLKLIGLSHSFSSL